MEFFAVFMNVAGAIASGVSIPISSFQGVGWRGSLAFCWILVLLAIALWIPQLKKEKEQPKEKVSEIEKENSHRGIWRSSLAWYITLFMGLQSLMFYTLITWLPEILQFHGYSPNASGWMLFLIPVTFIVPVYAERMKDQKILGGIVGSMFLLGILGILSGYSIIIPVAIVILGMACGAAFSLCMMLFSLRTKSSEETAEISGMAQSFGYLLAAIGPTLFGAMHDLTDGWQWPLLMLIFIASIIFVVAVASGKKELLNNRIGIKNVTAHSAVTFFEFYTH